ncbi:phage tail protein [Sphingomonas sp. QA11]|uniref:gp53-like domain-containing protein n=1 Tax=Sphingomonas sp. QA11 TaxID=2950605 RepID=UPI00234B5906|nr:hypothetical protein [Sphingomonas sp. QA11]WCM29195.1 phage tail protein [Sphingomonas sp. QA11]
MSALSMIITNAGRAALVNAGAGGTNAVRVTQVGLTANVVVVAPTLTALPGEFKRLATISGIAADAETVHLLMRDSSEDVYNVRAIGLYLQDGTLFAVYGQADEILGKAEVSTFLLAADLRFLPGEATLVQFGDTNFLNPPATETTKGVAYLATLVEALAGAVTDKIITPATMASVLANYVAADQLGIANGVATLGPDGKLLLSQRPPIDLIDVFPVANQAAMLALAGATVGDFAVRADNGLVYVLQALPPSSVASWLEISTPAPVSSVNGKVGTVVLSAADVGAVPIGRSIGVAGGVLQGGGDLSANRIITLPVATQPECAAGVIGDKVVTPSGLGPLVDALGQRVMLNRRIDGSGLVTGGGDLSADRTLDVPIASAAEILAGTENRKAITPAGLAGLPKSLTPNGYVILESGLIIQWVQYHSLILGEYAIPVSWPIVFPTAALGGSVSAWLAFPSQVRDMWAQLVAQDRFGCTVQLQRGNNDINNNRVDGFDVIILGY